MKDALPAHLIRARWLADVLPSAKIICAVTPAALDVLLYRPPAQIETVADPSHAIVHLFDALRDDPAGVQANLQAASQSLDQIAVASYILDRAQPEPTTVPAAAPIFPAQPRLDL